MTPRTISDHPRDRASISAHSPSGWRSAPGGGPALVLDQFDAVLFDLDGVLTDTASLHAAAWESVFTELFERVRGTSNGIGGQRPFTGDDYRRLVDGEPRLDGVRHVLADRGIALSDGDRLDPPGFETASAVAAEKDRRFGALLHREGPRPFPGSVQLLERLRAAGVAVGVVSASRHCVEAIDAAGLATLVDVVVDGLVAAAMNLGGKPMPASYLEAARRLGVDPARSVVVEDALAGVEAGRRGGFAVVVGVDRHHDPAGLRAAGADLVVDDLGSLGLVGRGPLLDGWHLTYRPRGAAGEGMRETLCTLGNGYLATRGAATWATDDGVHYPGTYLAGVFNRLESEVGARRVERESLVNAPSWLPLSFAANDGAFTGDAGVSVTDEELRLDVRSGVLLRRYRVVDAAGRRSAVTERRLVSMAEPHLAGLEVGVVAENWSGTLRVRSGIAAVGCADQTTESHLLSHCHLQQVASGRDRSALVWLAARTTQSGVVIAQAVRTRSEAPSRLSDFAGNAQQVYQERTFDIVEGARCGVEKVAATYTSRDAAITEPLAAARQAAAEAPAFADLLAAHRASWAWLWEHAALEVSAADRPTGLVNLHLFHLLQVAAPHVMEVDCGLGARGLHGEGYNGHVFWDELFVFPVLNLRFPEVSRALLRYRQRRLPPARRFARASGDCGARFPWQSGSDGRDETPMLLFNPRSGRWMDDRSAGQRHVGLAVAYSHWQHLQTTGDEGFLVNGGADVIFGVARHFAHLATHDAELGRHRIRGVMGPDEFHDGYPWSDAPGVDDNAYTNVLTAWLLGRALELADRLRRSGLADVLDRLGIDDAELALFDVVSRGLHVPFHDGVISQFAGYERLEPIDLDAYRARYGNIGRLDLILEAEGDSVRRYRVTKQADTLMLFYLFTPAELRETLGRLGYQIANACVRRTVDYYSARVTHGSTLSRVVHAWVAARGDRTSSWRHLAEALAADMADTQGGTTGEGIHLGAMAGTVDLLQRCYTGLATRGGALVMDPALPDELDALRLRLAYRGHRLDIAMDHTMIEVRSTPGEAAPITVVLGGRTLLLRAGGRAHLALQHDHGERSAEPRRSPRTDADVDASRDLASPVRAMDNRVREDSRTETAARTVTDPVCGMTIAPSAAAGSPATVGTTTYYFCSGACRERFEADPERYVADDD